MIAGNPSTFAIESNITQAYEQLSWLALGCFVIHISGRRYGVFKPDATMLACSFDEVGRRISSRGNHTVPFSELDAGEIALAFSGALYASNPEQYYFGIALPTFYDMIHASRVVWAPDGDEAFDDGSYVLQFDFEAHVRLIAFKSGQESLYDPVTLSDIWLEADNFYSILSQWHDNFSSEWGSMPKCEHPIN
ncbi:Imm42 family immunity protein [Aeoliella mucimassa]|uniref:Uncharacterized protein n=1 Tax=Aeoliella mucimassa TaxID=2527972 RepID=A0A518AHA7_9BACT|nr:Imm42 family immunity protein [Aeoliella mucimassa]QDU54111.1 hypothetical protein Pan181_02910 [Aeoliella mucimassa]